MHRISKIRIQNFRACRDVTIELSEFTPIIGPNNAGKSTILSALTWILSPSTLAERDFWEAGKPVVIEIEVKGVTTSVLEKLGTTHRKKIEPFLGDDSIRVQRTCDQPGTTGGKTIEEIWKKTGELPDDGEWVSNPGGIWQAIKAMFPEPIRVGAMEDSAEDSTKPKTTTTLGKLLSELTDEVVQNVSGAYAAALAEIDNQLSADGENRARQLKDFDEEASLAVSEFFPGVQVSIHTPTPELKDLIRSGTLLTSESGVRRDFSLLGHGAQRAIQMALIRVLADRKRAGGDSAVSRLLLIDEPELYLHPSAIYSLREALRDLSGSGYQVVVTTHSPIFVEESLAASTVIVGKDKKSGTFARPTMRSAIDEKISEAPHQARCLFSLTHSSEILFAESVILAEGKTEKRLLPVLYKKIVGSTLKSDRRALVDLGGVDNVANARMILDALGVESFVIADLDFAFRGAVLSGYLLGDDPDLLACKNVIASLASQREWSLDAEGRFSKSKSGVKTAARMYEELSQEPSVSRHIENLHSKLLAQNVWIWTNGAIEAHLGKVSKHEADWANLARRIEEERVEDVLEDPQTIVACIERLNSSGKTYPVSK